MTVLSLCTACASTLGGGPPLFEDVTLTLEVGAAPCATAVPDPATIWQRPASNGRPNQVRWVVDGPASYRWEMQGEANSPGQSFFGRRVIHCGQSSAPSGFPQRPGEGQWKYSISVYECDGNVPSQEPICEVDPVIIIRDDGGDHAP